MSLSGFHIPLSIQRGHAGPVATSAPTPWSSELGRTQEVLSCSLKGKETCHYLGLGLKSIAPRHLLPWKAKANVSTVWLLEMYEKYCPSMEAISEMV